MNTTSLAVVKSADAIDFSPVRNIIHDLVEKESVSSIAVGVALNGKIIWEEAVGLANQEKQIKATPQTLYSLASVTKPITATAVMVLAERGLIDIDKPINQYLTQAKIHDKHGQADQVTIRQVLSHTSGLPTYCHFYYENSD
ncbi:MAG: serine hydrolase, partial [Sedimentisphaerales bacterium]|nr:serine hydrolase [Sedimentisphaerales bacterium]